jgi:hypothetical protein
LLELAGSGEIRDWHAAPLCWSFGTLRRPRLLRSKEEPAGFSPRDPVTFECAHSLPSHCGPPLWLLCFLRTHLGLQRKAGAAVEL